MQALSLDQAPLGSNLAGKQLIHLLQQLLREVKVRGDQQAAQGFSEAERLRERRRIRRLKLRPRGPHHLLQIRFLFWFEVRCCVIQ